MDGFDWNFDLDLDLPVEYEAPGELELVFFHGGRFVTEGIVKKYVDGTRDAIRIHDTDKLCMWGLLGTATCYGHKMKKIKDLWWCEPGVALAVGLKVLEDDNHVQEMSTILMEKKSIDIYVEHAARGAASVRTRNVPIPLVLANLDESFNMGKDSDDEVVEVEVVKNVSRNVEEPVAKQDGGGLVEVNVAGNVGEGIEKPVPFDVAQLNDESSEDDGDGEDDTGYGEDKDSEDSEGSEDIDPEEEEEDAVDEVEFDSDDGNEELQKSKVARKKFKVEKARLKRQKQQLDEMDLDSIRVPDSGRIKLRPKSSTKDVPQKKKSAGRGPRTYSSTAILPDLPTTTTLQNKEEVYHDSNCPGDFIATDSSDSDADDAQRVQSSGLHFNPNEGNTRLFKDQIFKDLDQFKSALLSYSLERVKAFKYKKNDAKRVRAKCVANGCGWEILCSKHGNDNTFRVKTYHSKHTCLDAKVNKRFTAKLLSEKLKDDIWKMPFLRGTHIRALVMKKFGLYIDFCKARRAKAIVIKQMHMQYLDEFKQLRAYGAELMETNENSTVSIEGLLKAIADNLPSVEQRMCARHIYARFGKRYPDESLKLQFWLLARATNPKQFKTYLDEFKSMNAEAHDFLLANWDPRNWSLAFANDLSKCDVVHNNMCETFNGVILEARQKPIISMLEEIRVYVLRRLVKNRTAAQS
ncbi:Transposase, MuDR, plant [Corchorus olitorius]|uniref:Transposase, MuDR, plant n=1 Tax=Corchorus olitorius TaxID=93759 RepID=A0A1R3J4H1_9ROSI|nr:Transposase, MuDR, plant [Corchorus olitorius]